MSKNVIIYLRVSTAEQSLENQMPALESWVNSRGYNLTGIYQEQESAWRAGHQKELARLIDELPKRKVDIVLCWALDRLSRQGIGTIFQLINRFRTYGVHIVSYQESWTEQSGPLADLLYAISAWIAEFEAKRISERTRAGLARAKLNGKVLGRPNGSHDKRRRKRTGYLLRYAK
jgi:putative DNA-invertase from lambdoid prophage Rac